MRQLGWLLLGMTCMLMIFLGSAVFVVGVMLGLWTSITFGWQTAVIGLLVMVLGGVGTLFISK